MRHLAQITALFFCAMMMPLAAKEGDNRPPEGFFNGVYDMVGRTGDGALVDWKVLIREEKGLLHISQCEGLKSMGQLSPMLDMEDPRYFEGDGEYCFFAVDGGSYPALLCRAADGGLVTYFPDPEREPDSCK